MLVTEFYSTTRKLRLSRRAPPAKGPLNQDDQICAETSLKDWGSQANLALIALISPNIRTSSVHIDIHRRACPVPPMCQQASQCLLLLDLSLRLTLSSRTDSETLARDSEHTEAQGSMGVFGFPCLSSPNVARCAATIMLNL